MNGTLLRQAPTRDRRGLRSQPPDRSHWGTVLSDRLLYLREFLSALRRRQLSPTRFVLIVSIAKQQVFLFERAHPRLAQDRFGSDRGSSGSVRSSASPTESYALRRTFRASTSRFGSGQQSGSNRTPLGLHRIAEKIGGGQPVGTVFESRQPVGYTWQGRPDAAIVHRILWLDGLQPGFNQGGEVDTHSRYIYIHGLSNEPSLGRPASRGCVHLAGADLMPLFDRVPTGTLVWIAE